MAQNCRVPWLSAMLFVCWLIVPPASHAFEAKKSPAASPPVRIVQDDRGRAIALELTPCPNEILTAVKAGAVPLAVYVVDDAVAGDRPAMLGDFSAQGTTVRFTPRYPFRAGMKYRIAMGLVAPNAQAEERQPAGDRLPSIEIEIPDTSPTTRTEVSRIYPSASTLPENHLRFYIQFTEPMSRGDVYEHLRLLNKSGRPIERPFLELGEELWDTTAQRLTLLIDPGRIKLGLKPRDELGPVLEAGQEYTLVVDATFRDARGRPLVGPFRKTFQVAGPITTAIEPKEWKIEPPRVASTAALVVRLPRPLDRALMERAIAVVDERGSSVPGRVLIGSEERRWEYLPDDVWKAGTYQLVLDPVLEDQAGNQVGRPFEVDEKEPAQVKSAPVKVRIPFTIGKTAPRAGE